MELMPQPHSNSAKLEKKLCITMAECRRLCEYLIHPNGTVMYRECVVVTQSY